MRGRVHIFGASGSGTSTIGRAIAETIGVPYFEADDFFWEDTSPPYQHGRERSERQRLLTEALSGTPHWVLAGSVVGWGDNVIALFDLAVFVVTPTAIRLERLRARERARFGDRLLEIGDMYQQHSAFMAWASQYDEGSMDMRSRVLHEEWLSRLPCPVIRIDGSLAIDVSCAQVSAAIAARDLLLEELTGGFIRDNRRGVSVLYRFIRPTDDLEAITMLLHRAYAPLAAAGMQYVASHQSSEVTERRMSKGDTIVAVLADRIVGVVTLARITETRGSPFYDRADVARFGQFAVEPQHQHVGIGSTLLELVEALAVERGARELGLDTSEQATGLIQLYSSKGYRFIEYVRWSEVNYRSVVLAKTLASS